LIQASQIKPKLASERGEGKIKAVIVTLILAFGIYAVVKMLPPYIAEYQLSDTNKETARYASVTRSSEEQIRDTVWKSMQELDIPAKKEDLKIVANGANVTITLDYSVPVDLTVYKFDIHFALTSEQKAL
jgi:hypothetical protein